LTSSNTGSPSGDRGCDQPASRERQAGPYGGTERPVVLMKPGNAGGGKGPQLKGNARSNEGGGIGVEPNNPSKRSEIADGVARQSEGIAQLPLLRLVRQGVPQGRSGIRLRMLQSNGGAAGVDNQTFEDIETYGEERWLDELAQELKNRTYQPLPVRRVYIPKPDGKQRPLGVPAIRDRTAEMAAVLVLEPIFEADLPLEQYAYRRDRSALDAVRHVHKLINTGHGEIVDADLSSYFDTLPHSELLKSVARRVVDGAMLHLIKMWLEAPVEETDERGNKRRSTRNRDEGRGSPQGSPISPLLSNLYMRRFVLGWKKLGHERRLRAYIVNYADDLVICCRDKAADALVTMRGMMTKLKLTVNDTKTRVCKLPEEKFDFLGYTFGRCYSPKTGRAYLGSTPSKKRVQRVCEAISQETGRNRTLLTQETVITTLNRIMIGWANYFCLGPVSPAYRAVERHARKRLRQWLCAKHKLRGQASKQFSITTLHQVLGLVELTTRTSSLLWAKS